MERAVSTYPVLYLNPITTLLSDQKEIRTSRTRLNVTIWWYRSPKRRARSLSTHIAVVVRTETVSKKIPIDTETWYLRRYRIVFILTAPGMKLIARRGWVVSPTARSVTAKHWNNSFVWGRIEFTLRRAKRITTLPRNAVIEREKFRAARNT